MPASTDGDKVFCLYCSMLKLPPLAPVPVFPVVFKTQSSDYGPTFYISSYRVLPQSLLVFRNGLLQAQLRDYDHASGCVRLYNWNAGDKVTIHWAEEAL